MNCLVCAWNSNEVFSKYALTTLTIVLVFGVSIPAVKGASPPSNRPGQVLAEDKIEALERKLLQRTFPIDTEEKRLQRLECLVFGATQMGSLQERWAGLNRAITQPGSSPSNSGISLKNNVAELEKHILKKTNPALPIATRLNQLEAKVFGQTSPSMALPQRVERLQKTIGLANPFNKGEQTAIQPFSSLPNGSWSFRYYGDPNNLDLRQLDPQTSQMFREMERQMQQLGHLGDGMLDDGLREFDLPNGPNAFRYDFSLPRSHEMKPHLRVPGSPNKPGNPGFGNGKSGHPPSPPEIIIPNTPRQEIPPYGAPDSI